MNATQLTRVVDHVLDGSTKAKVSKSKSIPSKLSIPFKFFENAKSDINFTICVRITGFAK